MDCNCMDFALKRMIIKILLAFLKGLTLEFIFRKSEVHAIEPGMLFVDINLIQNKLYQRSWVGEPLPNGPREARVEVRCEMLLPSILL